MVYTPGVSRIVNTIAKDPSKAYRSTCKNNSIAVVTDGSATLGLGNLGPEAALPVTESNVMLLNQLVRDLKDFRTRQELLPFLTRSSLPETRYFLLGPLFNL